MQAAVETNTAGDYEAMAPDEAPWMLVPRKDGGGAGAVTALDASYVLQAQVGMRTLDAWQRLACDATGNGDLSSLDAARILQLVVGLRARLPVAERCGDWLFVPGMTADGAIHPIAPAVSADACRPGAVELASADTQLEGQDFTAILLGDCTGNWQPGGAALSRRAADGRDTVRVSRIHRLSDGKGRAKIAFRGGAPLQSATLALAYDATQVKPVAVRPARRAGGPLTSWSTDERGTLRIALAGARPLRGRQAALIVELDQLDAGRAAKPVLSLLGARVDE